MGSPPENVTKSVPFLVFQDEGSLCTERMMTQVYNVINFWKSEWKNTNGNIVIWSANKMIVCAYLWFSRWLTRPVNGGNGSILTSFILLFFEYYDEYWFFEYNIPPSVVTPHGYSIRRRCELIPKTYYLRTTWFLRRQFLQGTLGGEEGNWLIISSTYRIDSRTFAYITVSQETPRVSSKYIFWQSYAI